MDVGTLLRKQMPLRIIFAGTVTLAAAILENLIAAQYFPIAVYTQPDKPAGRGQRLQLGPVKCLALQHQLPVYQPLNWRDSQVQAELVALQPDLIIVVGYGVIIPETLLGLPHYGCINVHVSLLPRWRGAAPIQRAIQAGDCETGITIMQMDAGLDTGAILYQEACPITVMDTSGCVEQKLYPIAVNGLLKVIANLEYYRSQAQLQPEVGITYAAKIHKAETEINWHQPAMHLQRSIRAYNPVPGAYSWFASERVKIWQSQVTAERSYAAPGTIVYSSEHELRIATVDYDLAILELQLPGAKRLQCAEIMRSKSHYFAKGKCFESAKEI